MSASRVSICIPVYNREELLAQALESAIAQDYPELEIVVSDNCSTDATRDVAERFARRDPRIRVRSNEHNLGTWPNYAACIRAATGEYIKFLNSDDILHPRALSLMAPHLLDSGVKLVASRTLLVGAALEQVDQPWWTNPPLPPGDVRVPGLLFGSICLAHNVNYAGCPTTVLFRRSDCGPDQVATFGGRSWDQSGDLAMWLGLCLGGDIVFLQDPISSVRVHDAAGGRQPWARPLSVLEWMDIVLRGHQAGFVAEPAHLRHALATALRMLVSVPDALERTEYTDEILQGLAAGTAALAASFAANAS